MKKMNRWQLLLVLVLAFMMLAAAVEYRRYTNLRIKGWLFADTSWAGLRTWNKTGTVDTLVVSGIDTTCYFFAFPADSSTKYALHSYISRKNDTVFVRSDTSLTASERKYNWMVLRP